MALSSKVKSVQGAGCLVLFALPFAGVGVGMGVLLAWTLLEHRDVMTFEFEPSD